MTVYIVMLRGEYINTFSTYNEALWFVQTQVKIPGYRYNIFEKRY